MKAKLPEREPEQLAKWEQARLYYRILEARAGAPLYVLHDGPPYPTGEIHIGTGLNKIVKDMIVKSRTMAGFRSPYIPGWDCHGLPIETKVEKELGGKTTKVSAAEFRQRCRDYANRYVEAHKRDFRRLGIFGQWDKPYLTMDFSMEACTAGAFLDFLEKGRVYRGLKPVYWCIYDRTALAEAEVEYEDHTSPSVWVKFPIASLAAASGELRGSELHLPHSAGEKGGASAPEGSHAEVSALIWTTTPWTLPANRALAFHPEYEYVVADTSAGKLLLAKDRVDALRSELGLEVHGVTSGWKGREFEGAKFHHPFLELVVPGVLADYVTLDQGSGIVHTAPGHGAEDFFTGQKYGLEAYAPQDDDGRFTEGLPEYKGKTVFEANPIIVDLLKRRGMLVAERKLAHSYPHCWRCHNPVIFRATEQWFIGLDHDNLRQHALDEIAKVKWKPEWGQARIHDMVAERPDWCISRQRFWGVPLIVFYCEHCGKQLKDFQALRHVLLFFEREGADAWFTHSAEELLPPGTKCSCGASKWKKEDDVLDVWFDSGSTNLAVLKDSPVSNADGSWRPADIYMEGPDQYRGWFHSSLLVAVGVKGRAPYRQVMSHGWTLDDKGIPMSKSLGNAGDPMEICAKWGADIFRIWVSSQDFTADVRVYEAMLQQLAEAYRKIRNTFRFALSNLFDFDPARDMVPDSELWEMDAWMLRRTGELIAQCRKWYDEFEFHRVYHAVQDYCTVELSAFYFDVLKDRLYTFAPKNIGRRSAQTAVYRIGSAVMRLIAPTLVFTSEEAWHFLPHAAGDPESIHMTLFPEAKEYESALDEKRAQQWIPLLVVRSQVLSALERARNAKKIASSLQAKVTLTAAPMLFEVLRKHAESLPALFIVSQVHVVRREADGGDGRGSVEQDLQTAARDALPDVTVEHADGKKCERCWNYSTHVGENSKYPTVCERCVVALDEIERQQR